VRCCCYCLLAAVTLIRCSILLTSTDRRSRSHVTTKPRSRSVSLRAWQTEETARVGLAAPWSAVHTGIARLPPLEPATENI